MKVEHNISRLEYLLKLYSLNTNDFLSKISTGLKTPLTENDIFQNEIKIGHLKRIDKLFNKGIEFYLNPKQIHPSEKASIFFRKDSFNSELNIGSRKIVNKFEELKTSLFAISKLANIKYIRKFPVYSINDNPRDAATFLRQELYPEEKTNILRDFLKALIKQFAENNILVFEYVETWNKKDKSNINGFFLNPNVIVLKRQQKAFRREIFTLIHELGHYLLNEEEIEEVDVKSISNNTSIIENWCNEFAYFFLIGDFSSIIDNLENADASNDYHFDFIHKISQQTHLSSLALYTRLLYTHKISVSNYQNVKEELDAIYKQKIEEEEKQKELDKIAGIKRRGSVPKPINSPLFVNTLSSALQEGIINEYDFCKKLNIKPENIDQYIL